MSLKKNIAANYASQIYVTLIAIVVVPLYIKYLGVEAYGLIGFFAMLQSWFSLLDMGLTPTMARETSRFHGGALSALGYRRLVRALEGIFLLVAIIGGVGMYAGSGFIASDWLQTSKLPIAEVQLAIRDMALIVAMRWMCGLYRGALSGAERLVWLGGYSAVIATLRFVGVIPVLLFVGATPTAFFHFQVAVAIVELSGLLIQAYRLFPDVPAAHGIPWSWEPLRPVLKFSLTIAFTSAVWVLVTQTDKLVLSKILPLTTYGYFTLAVLVASGVMTISGPISSALLPRMSTLDAAGDHASMILVYRKATQLVTVIAGAASLTLAFCAEPLLWAWTGNRALAAQAAPVLVLYALGNGILAVSAFPYYLQYAKGDLRLHLIGNAVFVAALIPSIIWATRRAGGVGAGYVWLAMNLVTFIAWLPFVHRRFEPGLNRPWYLHDILLIVLPMALACYVTSLLTHLSDHRVPILLAIAFSGCTTLLAGALASSQMRGLARSWLVRRGSAPSVFVL
jgi:O-antigen/teichoic acid export membrane protein